MKIPNLRTIAARHAIPPCKLILAQIVNNEKFYTLWATLLDAHKRSITSKSGYHHAVILVVL